MSLNTSRQLPHSPAVLAAPLAFIRTESGQIFANASFLDGEWVSRYGSQTLEVLRRMYPDMALMSIPECYTLQNERFRQPWKEVTEARYIDQLEVLPPMDWNASQSGASFKSSEMYGGDVTSIFASKDGRFFECRDVCTLTHQNIIAAVTAQFFAGESVNSGH
ncbi:hypothetical protein [Siccibacter turicensis]|uniref:hypothetical protein n=1 Tax=Siccibacter turicensis TaxID=357233 RepID=UPI003F54864C